MVLHSRVTGSVWMMSASMEPMLARISHTIYWGTRFHYGFKLESLSRGP